VLAFLPATLLTRAEPMNHLVEYYVMTRPLGFWGPVRREAIRQGRITQADDARAWTRADWTAIVLSPIVFACLLFGLTGALLLQRSGWLLVVAMVLGVVMYRSIDPKLRAESREYEGSQAGYVADLERRNRWEGET